MMSGMLENSNDAPAIQAPVVEVQAKGDSNPHNAHPIHQTLDEKKPVENQKQSRAIRPDHNDRELEQTSRDPVDDIVQHSVEVQPLHQVDTQAYSAFTHGEKRIIVLCAAVCSFFSPVSGQIYFPALNTIAKDLHVSHSKVNLTITAYLILQGLAPSFVGALSDSSGRRPAYVVCFTIYMIANIGLGIQNSYAALIVLRCIQSAGSSGTVALANAVVADIVTSQERGIYVSYMSVAPQAGPSLGPIIGGLLAQYLGCHSIFWFLLITAGVVFIPMLLFFPETCRRIVEDGSVPPVKWNRCYINKRLEARLIQEGRAIQYAKRDQLARERKFKFPNPLESVRIIFMKESGFALIYIGIVCCALYSITALIPSTFGRIYNFNEIQIALCYIPLGCGSMLAAFVRGRMIDSRFRVHAKRLGMPLEKNRRVDLSNFPIERARIEVALPTLALGCACIIGFGWLVQCQVSLAGPLILEFVIGFCVSASMNSVAVLMVDVFPGKAGSATAANNLVRCWLGAGATAGVVPMIEKIGVGLTTTFFGLLPIVLSPILFYIMAKGPSWRRATREKKERDEADKRRQMV